MTEHFHVSAKQPTQTASRIEGGVDAIVVGASIDGLIAAAYLGKAGLKTILLEAGLPQPELRPFTPGYFADDGDFLIRDLDAEVVDALDLYRHGLEFVQRRFESIYYFSDQSALHVSGDLFGSFQSIAEMDEQDADTFQTFAEETLAAAKEFRPYFNGQPLHKLSKRTKALFHKYGTASIDDVLDAHFNNELSLIHI